jgi:hypothetical protein
MHGLWRERLHRRRDERANLRRRRRLMDDLLRVMDDLLRVMDDLLRRDRRGSSRSPTLL